MPANDQHGAARPGKQPLLSRAAWARVLPFLVYLAFFLVEPLLASLGVAADSLRYLYPVKTVAVVATLAYFWRDYTELHRWDMTPKGVIAALAVGAVVFVLWISLSTGWMVIGAPGGYDPSSGGQVDWLLVAARIAGAALVVPVMEELFWRSFLMRWLDKNDFLSLDPARVTLQSAAIGAVIFGFEHHLWLAGIVAGAAYSWLYVRQRSLWAPVIAHALTNGVLGCWVVYTGNWTFW
ncbi:CAAX prenyl protease-related protein [Massilia sp. PAMC28688]|uniref:CAAX prenyl protease-related protein n=1 Tax=Massilia sp. PAMC28688 TaxID=2861283 RepID=UPI001C6253E6|nr:CAAX prenyl protease-related protein [Massilia sp. PAMC28688]QYF94011.1 CAAX prenyl protease-related protein [Massilia sp. PAMC28688]